MQNDQHADAQIASEPAPASCATPPKKRGRLVTFFAKMYSPHGTLTCKEFIWPAVYLLTLGTIFARMMLIPLELLAFNTPLRDTPFVVKAIIVFYATCQHIMLFAYPLFNIYRKLLKNTPLKKTCYTSILCIVLAFTYTYGFFLKGDSILYYSLGYMLCIFLTLCVFIIGKIFCARNENTIMCAKHGIKSRSGKVEALPHM